MKQRATKQHIQSKCDKGSSLTSLESAPNELFSSEGCSLQDRVGKPELMYNVIT